MGKNAVIKTIAYLISGMVAHKVLIKYTNKPESVHHMESEIDNYRGIILDYIAEFNWNADDKKRIKEKALKSLKSEIEKPHFKDVKFPMNEAEKLIEATLIEFTGE